MGSYVKIELQSQLKCLFSAAFISPQFDRDIINSGILAFLAIVTSSFL